MYPETTQLLILSLVILALLLNSCEGSTDRPRVTESPTQPFPPSMKGYELYSWRIGQEWHFSLFTATNRAKTLQEITRSENVVGKEWVQVTVQGIHDLQVALEQLPPDTYLAWKGPQTLRQLGGKPGDLMLPPRRTIEDVKAQCQELGVRLEVTR